MVIENISVEVDDLQGISVAELIENISSIKERTYAFLEQKATVVYAEQSCLAVIESECAILRRKNLSANSPRLLGSDWATTCVIVIVESPSFVACAHIADPETVACILGTVVKKLNLDLKLGTLDVYLIGGFTDGKPKSKVSNLSSGACCQILTFLLQSELNFNLKLMACHDVNSCEKKPIHMGVAYCIETGEVFPADLQRCFGPDIELRRARLGEVMTTNENALLFEPEDEQLRIYPFEVSIPPRELNSWMNLPSEIILQYFSTSPQAEPDGFVEAFRMKCHFLLNNMVNEKSVFVQDKPRIHQLDAATGFWSLVV